MDSLKTLINLLGRFDRHLDRIIALEGKKGGRWEAVRERAETVKEDFVKYSVTQLERAMSRITTGEGLPESSLGNHILEMIDDEEGSRGLLGLAQAYEKYHSEQKSSSRRSGREKLELLEDIPDHLAKIEEFTEDFIDDLDEANEESKTNFKQHGLYGHFKNGVYLVLKSAKAMKRHDDLETGKGKEKVDEFFALARHIKPLVKAVSRANDLDTIKRLAGDFYNDHFDTFNSAYREWTRFEIEPVVERVRLRKKVINQPTIDKWAAALDALRNGGSALYDFFDTLEKISELE